MGEWNPTFLTSDPLARRIAKEIDPGGDLDDWERVIAKYLPQWQPIETAPRDGIFVIVGAGDFVRTAQWISSGNCPNPQWGWHTGRGWVEPTHWMPMPAPPTTGDDK